MLQNVQDSAWNETSHLKSVHVYVTFYFIKPYQPFDAIKQGHLQHTVKPHFHSVSVSVVIFHTAHRATGSSSLVVYIYTQSDTEFQFSTE